MLKRFSRVCLLMLLLCLAVSSVYAIWTYTKEVGESSYEVGGVGMGDWDVFNYDEVVITKITLVSNTTTNQTSSCIKPTNVESVITGRSGQKVVYKIDAHNYSETDSFVYAGVDYDSDTYNGLNKISISISLDEQGTNLINNSLSSNAHKGNAIAPGEDFVFYITYTLTGNISDNEVLVNYVFKPIIYTVTYLNNNQTFAVEHITNNQSTYSVISEKPTQSGATFAGWVNANALKV